MEKKQKQKIELTKENVKKALFEYGYLPAVAKELDIEVSDLLYLLRAYRKEEGGPAKTGKPDPNFKDPFPSRNIHHPDKLDNFGHWNYKHHYMKNERDETVGPVRFPYSG